MSPDQMTDAQKRVFDNIVKPVSINPRVKGRFKLRAMKGDLVLRETAWCPNLILNGYFDHLFTYFGNNSGVRGFVAGAGTATPLETNTALQSYLGGGNSFQESWRDVNSTVAPRSVTIGFRIRAGEGAVVGNVSEIALYYGTGGALAPANNRDLMNRALVVDEMGNPTSISVRSDEFLEVVWEFVFYVVDGATGTLTINIDGTPTHFDYEVRPISMGRASYHITASSVTGGYAMYPGGAVSVGGINADRTMAVTLDSFWPVSSPDAPVSNQVAGSAAFTSRTLGPYVPASKQRLSTIRLPLNNGNYPPPGVRSLILLLQAHSSSTMWFGHQMLLDGPFEKKATHLFDLPVNVSMENA